MKGVAYLGDSRVEVRDYARPAPGPGEVVVQMKAAGLCGSDLHKYHRDRGWADERAGMIAGHEPAGVIAEVGAGVEEARIGERVSVYHSLGCGRCVYCESGMPVFCEHEGAFGRTRDGCHADFMSTPVRYCMPLPEVFSFSVGAMLACTAGTAYAALMKLGLPAGETVVVFGLGPVGLTVFLLAGASGLRSVGIDLNPSRIEKARSLNVGSVIDASKTEPVAEIRKLTGGRGVVGAIECSGSEIARSQVVDVLSVRGTAVIVGAGSDRMSFDAEPVIRKELTIRGNAVYSTSDYFRLLEFLQKHAIDLDRIVTDRYRIDEAAEAFARFDRGESGKSVFLWPD